MEFHDRLALIMDKRGLKQVNICELTGLSSAQVNHIVTGRTKDPKLSTAVLIANALGVSLDWLAGRSDDDARSIDKIEYKHIEQYRLLSDGHKATIDDQMDYLRHQEVKSSIKSNQRKEIVA